MNEIKIFFKDAYNELVNFVSWPKWDELQTSTIQVVIGTVILALAVFAADTVFSWFVKQSFQILNKFF
ncbi:MAG: preprotein translocase subunit SecE [Flavobacteriaceae bacterium]|nr:MAG: preprotein translocase subunit SecE [Flavobacteriaceae bacterium]